MIENKEILKQYWGFESFRPQQEDIIQAVLGGIDTLALMPTGGGKSLCYQVPVMAKPGLGLVISPLIALMKDQVEGLRRKNITAFAIYSGMSIKEVIHTLRVASDSNCKFLFVSPERLESKLFQEYLPGLDISLIAVDEAHCISQWGYDFRPPYLRIAKLRVALTGIPVLALTASATPEVQDDICKKLGADKWEVFKQSFERPNLSYSIFQPPSKINKIFEILRNVQGTAIIYCRSRRKTKEIAALLQLQKLDADYYHAGLTSDERNTKQENWIQNKTRVIVCTNAFGMGIDKPDVRTVIHVDIPECLENYYQEAGRAGRDGKRSYAVLLFEEKELDELYKMVDARFPTLAQVREVYQAIANYLQIPSGTGQGNYFEFDLADFLVKFKLPSSQVLHSLKTLEVEGFVSFNEQVFLSSTISFTCSKEQLYDFEKQNPSLDLLLKTLLRTYEGIFDQPMPVSEKLIAGLIKKELSEVKERLAHLHQSGVIEYSPQKNSPQLYFLTDRKKSDDVRIDMQAQNFRKKQLKERVEKMIGFVNEKSICRSRYIGTYFGDSEIPDCGICDNCLAKRNNQLGKLEFESMRVAILDTLKQGPIPVKDLTVNMGKLKKEKAWKVIEFLQAEKVIEMNENGLVCLSS